MAALNMDTIHQFKINHRYTIPNTHLSILITKRTKKFITIDHGEIMEPRYEKKKIHIVYENNSEGFIYGSWYYLASHPNVNIYSINAGPL